MITKRLGNIGESKAIAKFVEMQIPVYQPFGDAEVVDLVADFNGKLQKIQVKTSEKCIKGKITFSLVSSTMHRKHGTKHVYTSDEIDYFALYNLDEDLLLLIPQIEVDGAKALTISYPNYKPSRNQYRTLNWKDYTFENIICVETKRATSKKEDDIVQTTTDDSTSGLSN